jgi:hypothetical protein
MSEPARSSSLPPWAGRVVRLLAVLLFLFIGWLTLPKLAPRMNPLAKQREARAEIARNNAGQSPLSPEEVVRPTDVLLIVAVTLGGGFVLLSVGYFALRGRATADEMDPSGRPPQE